MCGLERSTRALRASDPRTVCDVGIGDKKTLWTFASRVPEAAWQVRQDGDQFCERMKKKFSSIVVIDLREPLRSQSHGLGCAAAMPAPTAVWRLAQ